MPVTKNINTIYQLLHNYCNKALQAELDTVIAKKGITRVDYEKVLRQQQRTKQK